MFTDVAGQCFTLQLEGSRSSTHMSNSIGVSQDDCINLCASDPVCEAAVYKPNEHKCLLKTAITGVFLPNINLNWIERVACPSTPGESLLLVSY